MGARDGNGGQRKRSSKRADVKESARPVPRPNRFQKNPCILSPGLPRYCLKSAYPPLAVSPGLLRSTRRKSGERPPDNREVPLHDVGSTAGSRRRRPGVSRAADAAPPMRRPRSRPTSATTATSARIFQQHCQGCHQPAKPQGGFVMTELRRPAQDGRPRQARRRPRQARQELRRRADHAARTARRRDAQEQGPAAGRRRRAHHEVDRPGGQGRHARHRPRRRRRRASAGLRPAAGDHVARLSRPTASCWPSPAITKCCCTRPTAPAWSAGWSACRSASSRWPSRRTAS